MKIRVALLAALVATAHWPASAQNADRRPPTLFVIGDSTVKNGTAGQVGWGDRVGEYFDQAAIRTVNAARGGRSSRTYQTEHVWDAVLDTMTRGDVVIMQFGHNDASPLFTSTRPRGSIKGTGEETEAGTIEITGEREIVHSWAPGSTPPA